MVHSKKQPLYDFNLTTPPFSIYFHWFNKLVPAEAAGIVPTDWLKKEFPEWAH